MSNQIQITGGAKVRNLNGVLTGTSGIVSSLGINVPDGIPQLDGSGKILVSQLPNSVMEYKGTWNVSTNTPYLVNGVGNAGDVYIVTGAATGGTNHDFGAGNILFYNGDQAIYDGSAWQRASGSTGSVTSVAMTTPTGLSVTGSPITTSGTLALSLSSGYIIPTTSFLNGLVPYTGATQTVDLGSYDLNARGIKINGTAGTGHADFKHQSGTPTGSASSSTLYADTDGDLAWKNDHSYITTFIGSLNTANRDYTLPNASGTLALTSDLSSFVSASPVGVAGNIPYFTGSYTLGNENGFMYDSSTNRFGVNTTVPNATIGANASIDSGYSLLLKNADANYNGIGFGINTTYGNTFETQKLGVANAMNLTLLNQSGYISLTEGGNLGINILSPIASPSGVGSKGIDIYGDSQAASIGFHNAASGTGNTNGAYLYLTNTGTFTLRNLEGGIGASSLGDFSVVTNSTENFRVNSVDGTIWQSNIPNALLKTVSGVLTAAVAGTDYVAPSALSGYVPTSRTLTINGTTYDLSANRSWSVGTTTGSGSADSVAFWNSSSNLTYDSVFYYSSTNKRLGVNTTSPNATIGANAGIDSGYSLLLKNAETNYNGLGFGINSTYGNTIETVKVGTAAARNLTLFNQTGYASLTEAGNFGFNILTPTASPSGVGSVGIDIFGGASAAGLGFHNTASGTGNTNGAYLYLLNNSNFTIRNLEGPIGVSSLGDFSVVTNSTENFRVNSSNGTIWQSNISDAMLKTVSGVLTAAVAGTDYVAPSALSSYVPTSRTITINGTTQDLSANRSWSVGTVTGSGTATRVAFWDGSSSLSSNTNLYWDNTNSRLGVGLTNPQRALEIYSASADTHLRLSGAAPSVSMGEAITGAIYQAKFGLATANNQFVTGSVAGDFVINCQTGSSIFAYNSTEAMRIDTNRNVGIGGIANSSYRLHVFGTAPILAIESNTTGNVTLRFLQTGFNVSGISYINSDSSLRFTNNNGALIFNTGLVNGALTLASGGAATFSSSITSTLTSGIFLNNSSGGTDATQARINNTGGDLRIGIESSTGGTIQLGTSAYAAVLGNQANNPLQFTTNGTARMTITNAGNVGIATTSPSDYIDAGLGLAVYNSSGRAGISIVGNTTTADDVLGRLSFTNNQSTNIGSKRLAFIDGIRGADNNSAYMSFSTANSGLGTEKMRLTSGGNLWVGGTSFGSDAKLGVSNSNAEGLEFTPAITSNTTRILSYNRTTSAYIASLQVASEFQWQISGTERMRITSGGNLLIGTTTDSARVTITAATGAAGMRINTDSGQNAISIGGTGIFKMDYPGVGGGRFEINDSGTAYLRQYSNGTLSISSGQIISSSDINLKNDDGGIENALDKVLKLNPRYFYWKEESNIDTTERQLGFYAQEVKESLGIEVANESENGKWGIYDRGIIAMLTKAIQEQQAQIEELKAKIN